MFWLVVLTLVKIVRQEARKAYDSIRQDWHHRWQWAL